VSGATQARADALPSAEFPCPAGSLPDDGACIPVPTGELSTGPERAAERNVHRDRLGRVESYEHIPLQPERSADYKRYRFPIPIDPARLQIGSGYDLHLPDGAQRRGSQFKEVGHGGIDLAAPRGTPVRPAALEHQDGAAEVLFSGELFGTTVVTRHAIREGGGLREYLVLYGHLERAAPGLVPGAALTRESILGLVGDTGSPGIVHLHLEIRRVRDGVRVRELGPRELVHNARTIAVDPRNVLELSGP
jgi:murein DD-endopeptidase MepM/ murein hydrolase activator NlpD